MKEALKEANKALLINEIPIGAVIVDNNRIIAKAHNQVEMLNDSTAHAEMLALTSAFSHLNTKYLPECTLYVTLEPCLMCAGAAFWSHINKIVFGAYDLQRGFFKMKDKTLNKKTVVIPGIMEKESKDLLDSFFIKLRE